MVRRHRLRLSRIILERPSTLHRPRPLRLQYNNQHIHQFPRRRRRRRLLHAVSMPNAPHRFIFNRCHRPRNCRPFFGIINKTLLGLGLDRCRWLARRHRRLEVMMQSCHQESVAMVVEVDSSHLD